MKFNAGDRFRTVSGAWEQEIERALGTRDKEELINSPYLNFSKNKIVNISNCNYSRIYIQL